MQLPCYLNASWPVVGIGDRGIPTFGQTRGFCIKNQIHKVVSICDEKGMNKSTEEDRFDKIEL